MQRLLSSLAAAAFVLSLGVPTLASSKSTTTGAMTMSKHSSCPKGQTWVHGYTTKAGKKVKGYCRKGK